MAQLSEEPATTITTVHDRGREYGPKYPESTDHSKVSD